MVRVGIVGLGYWGPNLVRTFTTLPDSRVTGLSDLNEDRLRQVSRQAPDALATPRSDDILDSQTIDAAVIAAPTRTHYALAKKALLSGLHTFVEKPLATSVEECEELIELADRQGVLLFVGHVFLYTSAVAKLKDLIRGGELGSVSYISSSRLNLGPIRRDVNALWDLAPHDISIILELMGASPVAVNCQGLAYLDGKIHDVCFLTLRFGERSMAHVHVSWLDPNKRRLFTVVGDKKMAIYDDLEPSEKVKVYDKGVEVPPQSDIFADFHVGYRYGDTYSPRLTEVEPLKAECQHFLDCIQQAKRPKTDGEKGLEVVRVLEAAQASLLNAGGRVGLVTAVPAGVR